MRGMEERNSVKKGRWALPACLVLVALGLGGCTDSIECCQDGATAGAVTGVVVNVNQQPQSGVTLKAIDFQAECQGWVAPGPFGFARSDEMGKFEMPVGLVLMRPADYCFKIEMALGDLADTTGELRLRSYDRTPPDTTRVTLVVPW
jgi:hypothetical protein